MNGRSLRPQPTWEARGIIVKSLAQVRSHGRSIQTRRGHSSASIGRIEAVAKALKEKGYLHAQQVENICNRLARRQRVKRAVEHRPARNVVRRQPLKQ